MYVYNTDDSYPSNNSPNITPSDGPNSIIKQPKRSIIGIRQQLKAYRSSIAATNLARPEPSASHTRPVPDVSSAGNVPVNTTDTAESSFIASASASATASRRTSGHDSAVPVAVTVPSVQDIPMTPERTPEVQRLVEFYSSADPTEHLFDNMWDDYLEE